MEKVPELRIVMEHITTKDAADFVQQGPDTLAASITPQHMLFNRNALFLVSTWATDGVAASLPGRQVDSKVCADTV